MHIFTKSFLYCLYMFSFLSASAQLADTVEHPAAPSYHVVFATMGSFNNTNAGIAYLLNNNVNLEYNTHKSILNVFSNWIYGQFDHTLTNNDFTGTVNFDYLKNIHKLYYWGLLNYQSSYSLKTRYRFQPGAGLGYNFVKTDSIAVSVSDGILLETADLADAKFGKEQYQTLRNSLRIKYHFVIAKIIQLDGIDFWQPSLSGLKDYNVQFVNSVALKLNKWLSLASALNYNKISRTGSENLLLTFGITLDKYF